MFASFIDIDKTIRRRRLVQKFSGDILWAYLFGGFLSLVLTLVLCAIGLNPKNHISTTGTIIITMFVLWMFFNFLFLNHVVVINGKSDAENRALICTLLNSHFQDIHIKDNGGAIIRSNRVAGGLKLKRTITVILKNEQLYINIINLDGRGGVFVFNGLLNYLKCKHIAREFQKRLS